MSLPQLILEAQVGGSPANGQAPRAQQLPLSGRTASGDVIPMQTPGTGAGGAASVNTLNSQVQVSGSYQGSIPSGNVSSQPIALSLTDAIHRGIEYNLGAVGAGEAARYARAQRLASAAQLLPDLNGNIRETVQQVNLAAQGLRINIPGLHFPTVVGPFNYFDLRATVTETGSLTGYRNWRSSQENARAAQLSIRDSRDLVALAVSGTYLQLIASAARIETAKAQIERAGAVYQQAVDRNRSGLNAHIDVNRSLVELQMQKQRLTSLANDFEKQKIALARLIGLPMAQRFELSDQLPYRAPQAYDVNDLIHHALEDRADVKAAASQVKAADLARKAAVAEYYPTVDVNADYGAIGVNPSQSHGTFGVTGEVRFPIYRSGRIRADIDQADAVLGQRKAEYEDLRGRAEQDVRDAFLDLTAASQQVEVAASNRTLASETLSQAADRFRAGVADTIEVVQAQETVATSEQDYISALYAFNLAQVALARSLGHTEEGVARMIQGK
jgi:outer membrane protein TolC